MGKEEKDDFSANKKRVVVTMVDGKVFEGVVNIKDHERLSDLFMDDDSRFIILYEMSLYDLEKKSVYFINKDHVVYVQPLD